MNVIKNNIKYLCKIHKIKIKDLEQELKIKNKGLSRVYFYKNVKLSQLESIAKRFNAPLNLLVYTQIEFLEDSDMYNLITEEINYYEHKKNDDKSIKKR